MCFSQDCLQASDFAPSDDVLLLQARAMMLTSMDPHRRRRVLKTMKHEQNAAILVSMNSASRKSVLEDLDANGDTKMTMDVIRYGFLVSRLPKRSRSCCSDGRAELCCAATESQKIAQRQAVMLSIICLLLCNIILWTMTGGHHEFHERNQLLFFASTASQQFPCICSCGKDITMQLKYHPSTQSRHVRPSA